MSDIAPSPQQIQLEAVQQRAPVSESLMGGIGGSINFLLGNIMPVGSIVPSMLNEATFQAQTSIGWVLADGRNVLGSSYSDISGFANIPDARGVTLRGKNNGRSTSSGNADGDLQLGTYQGDQILSHDHNIVWYDDTGATGTGIEISEDSGSFRINAPFNISSAGGNESRMRNVTVNYFVRIN